MAFQAPQFPSTSFGLVPTMIAGILGALFVLILVLQWLNHTRRITEARLKTVEKLAKDGLLDRAQLERLTRPPRMGRRVLYFGAWLLMLAGILCFILGGFSTFYTEFYVTRGVILSFLSTAIFATPVLFRELEKQGLV